MYKRNVLAVLALTPAIATANVRYHEVPVIDVEEILETVETVEPKERCWFETVRVRDVHSTASAPLIGALIGGAIGNAVGHKKRNKQVGAVIGTILGGGIGYDISRRDASRSPARRVRQEVCEVVEQRTYQRRVTGYLVTYRYAGETYRTRMARHPGDSIRVRVRVSPAQA